MSRRVAPAPRRLGRTAVEMLESLYCHRLLSTSQLRELHAPAASRRWAQGELARLREAGFARSVRVPGGLRVWFLTLEGAEAAETITTRAEERRKLVTPAQAAGPLQQHTLAVNEAGIAFVRAARERGEECGPFAWRHEVAHSLGRRPGQRRAEQLIADAVLVYQQGDGSGEVAFHYRFLELDRATMSAAQLAAKLARYARLYERTVPADDPLDEPCPAWASLYPVFPTVICVFAGREREALERRRRTVLALLAADPELSGAPEVEISACLLEDLLAHGPFAPVFCVPGSPGRAVDWLGGPAAPGGRG